MTHWPYCFRPEVRQHTVVEQTVHLMAGMQKSERGEGAGSSF
jgi:hypothetical protein